MAMSSIRGAFDVKGGEEDDERISWNDGISPASCGLDRFDCVTERE
jgi:hypothetical protein